MKEHFFFLMILMLVACGQNKTDDVIVKSNDTILAAQDSSKTTSDKDSSAFTTPRQFTPLTFIKEAANKSHSWISMADEFPIDWVQPSDIDTLMKLISVSEKCNCFVSPLSSYLPAKNSADIGGYAIVFINSYRDKKQIHFGLSSCPRTDKSSVDEITKWWTNYKRIQ